MTSTKASLRICPKGHQFYKSSSCPVCPICEHEKKAGNGFLALLSAPARRALEGKKITTLKNLSKFSEADILQLHGMGKSTIPKLREALQSNGLAFKSSPEKTIKLSEPAAVDTYVKTCRHPLLNVVKALRKIILAADKTVGEEIAWNAPSFFYTGKMKPFNPKEYKRFIVGFNLYKKDCIRLIFLTGAKLNDKSGLLEGDYADGRRLALFYNMNDVKNRGQLLQKLIKKWIKLLDK